MVVGGIHVIVLDNIFFYLIEKFRVLTQDDHMRERGPRRRDVVKVYGAGEFLSRYKRLKCYLARFHVQEHVFGLNWAFPPSYRYPRRPQ